MAIAMIMAITATAIPIVRPDIVARPDAGAAVGAGVADAGPDVDVCFSGRSVVSSCACKGCRDSIVTWYGRGCPR